MTVSVDVEVARSPRALVIPAEAVRDLFSPRPWVVAVRHGRAERQQVRLGVRGAGMLEVRSGVTEGEAVLLATARWVKIGQRVRRQLEEAPGAL
jgi:HlyD family secretion protein